MAGDYDAMLPKLNLAQRQIPIRVRLDEALRHDLDAVRQLRVPANKGAVPLEVVADIRLGSGPAQIDRLDRQRNVTIDVELGNRDLGAVVAEANELPALKGLPPGISRPPSGDAERMAEFFGSFGSAMLIGGLLTSTVLSLLVIPVVFTYVEDLLLLLKRLAGCLHRANHGVATAGS